MGPEDSEEVPEQDQGVSTEGSSPVPVEPLSGAPPRTAYPTRCPVEGVGFDGWDSDRTDLTLSITELGKPHEDWRSSYLYTEGTDVKVVQYARTSDDTYTLTDGSFEGPSAGGCDPDFHAFGYVFTYQNASIRACDNDSCQEIEIKEGTNALTYAAGGGAVLAATNHGDLLRFDANGWCRMREVEEAQRYECLDNSPGPDIEPGMQWYGSVPYGDNSLIADFPYGAIWLFDGESLSRSKTIDPEKIRSPLGQEGTSHEAQTLAFYCGALWVGHWPCGELLRFDGENWTKPFSLFSVSEPKPLMDAATQSGEHVAFLRQRVTGLAVQDGRLLISTSNLWPAQTQNDIDLPSNQLAEYGAIYAISDERCLQ